MAQHLAFEGLLEALRGAIIKYLEDVTPQILYEAIKEDVELWPHAPKMLKKKGQRWVNQVRRFKYKITPERIIGWIKEDRMDLASLIVNMGPTGKKWFVKQVEEIKNQLWPLEDAPKRPELGLKTVVEASEEHDDEQEPPPEQPKSKIRYL